MRDEPSKFCSIRESMRPKDPKADQNEFRREGARPVEEAARGLQVGLRFQVEFFTGIDFFLRPPSRSTRPFAL